MQYDSHIIIVSKKTLDLRQTRAVMDLISENYYTIKLSTQQITKFWQFIKKKQIGRGNFST